MSICEEVPKYDDAGGNEFSEKIVETCISHKYIQQRLVENKRNDVDGEKRQILPHDSFVGIAKGPSAIHDITPSNGNAEGAGIGYKNMLGKKGGAARQRNIHGKIHE